MFGLHSQVVWLPTISEPCFHLDHGIDCILRLFIFEGEHLLDLVCPFRPILKPHLVDVVILISQLLFFNVQGLCVVLFVVVFFEFPEGPV